MATPASGNSKIYSQRCVAQQDRGSAAREGTAKDSSAPRLIFMQLAPLLPTLVAAYSARWHGPLLSVPRSHVARSHVHCMAGNADILQTLKQLEEETAEAAAAAKARKEADTQLQRQQQNKVSAFGARLDDDVAGIVKVGDSTKGKEEYEIMFDRGNALMLRGEYKLAVKAFTQATVNAPGGMNGRKGGQYAIYLAQALQAAERRNEAVKLLKTCEAHSDGDVRKIAESVLYIMQAPELKLDAEQFISIPKLTDDWGSGRTVRPQEDPPPEKYSLEWYVQEAEKRKNQKEAEEASPLPALVASGALLLSTAALLTSTGASAPPA